MKHKSIFTAKLMTLSFVNDIEQIKSVYTYRLTSLDNSDGKNAKTYCHKENVKFAA